MRTVYGMSVVGLLGLCSLSYGQLRREERREERAAPVIRREVAPPVAVATGTPDQQIAACLYGANRNEIELARLAQEKATNEDVRDFAAMMVKDHTPVLQKLQKAAGSLVAAHAAGTPAAAVREEEGRDAPAAEARERVAPAAPPARVPAGTPVPGAAPRAAAPAAALDWVLIHRQVADECLASAKAELEKKEGAQFDHCFMGGQIMAHMKVLDEIKVLRNYVSAELQKDLDESSKMASHHLEEAKKIAESLMKADGERVSRKPKAP